MLKKIGFVMLVGLTLVGCQSKLSTPSTVPSTTTRVEVSMTPSSQTRTAPTEAEVAALTKLAETSLVRITTTKGVIDLELYPDVAPVHVANFLKLIQVGFYDGLSFHRVVPNFVVQGGDPEGNGSGGPGYSINAEFNNRKHLVGTLAMARSSDPNSAGSQFYLTLAPQPSLDGQYTVFGQMTSDMSVLTKMVIGDVMTKLEIIPKTSVAS